MDSRVLCSSTSAVAQFAAAELNKYLSLLCEATDRYLFELVEDETLAPEEQHILIGSRRVTLKAGTKGLLFAVYEFLEKYCGCSFGAMNHPEVNTGEFVPRLDELKLPQEEHHHIPDLPYRTAIIQYNAWAGNADHGLNLPFFDWLAKNRYNRLLTWMSCYQTIKDLGLLPELEKRGIALTVGHHQAIYTFLPPFGNGCFATSYREKHPEYYRLTPSGERYMPTDLENYDGQWLLCGRNEDCINTVAENILTWLEQNPLVDTVAFWPNDGKQEDCCCPLCASHTKTENYLYFNDALSRRIAKKRPEVKIDALIYMDLWDCPPHTRLGENTVVDIAMCTDTFRPYGRRDGGCVLGTEYEKNLRDYRAACPNVVAYEYYMGNYSNLQKLVPAADEMQSIFARMKEWGISGSGTQLECFNHWNNLFNFYSFARTADDVKLSVEDNLGRFCRIFGEGAPMLREIITLCEDELEGQVSMNDAGTWLMEHISKPRIYALFDAALAAAVEPRARNNIRMMRMAFRYSDLAVAENPPVEDNKKPTQYEDKTGELGYIATRFDSFFANRTGYGIALPVANRNYGDTVDRWYLFE